MPSNMQGEDDSGVIMDVWKHNLEEEFRTIRKVVQLYPFVAMDSEFPGVVARPIGEFRSPSEFYYQRLRCNVNILRIIQLGFSFMNAAGEAPPGCSTWQFNFKFSLIDDMYAHDSIELLQNSGIQFKKHEEEGIEPTEFAELLMTSGLVLMDDIKWLCFHSGYDFGYLVKLLTDQSLPEDEIEFFDLLSTYFPHIYDIKYMMRSYNNFMKCGLQDLADKLCIKRIGPQHQAGSDALITGKVFFKIIGSHVPNKEIDSITNFLEFSVCEPNNNNYIQTNNNNGTSGMTILTKKTEAKTRK